MNENRNSILSNMHLSPCPTSQDSETRRSISIKKRRASKFIDNLLIEKRRGTKQCANSTES